MVDIPGERQSEDFRTANDVVAEGGQKARIAELMRQAAQLGSDADAEADLIRQRQAGVLGDELDWVEEEPLEGAL